MAEQVLIAAPKRIDANSAGKFDAQVKEIIASGAADLLFDLEETVYVSSAGLRVFLNAQKKMNALGGEMALRNVRPQIMEIFEVTGLSGVLTII